MTVNTCVCQGHLPSEAGAEIFETAARAEPSAADVLTNILSHRGQQCALECRRSRGMAKEQRDDRERNQNVLEPVDWSRLFFWLIVHYICLKTQSTH